MNTTKEKNTQQEPSTLPKTFTLKCEITHPYAGSRRMVWVERPDNPMRHGWHHDTGKVVPEMKLTPETIERIIQKIGGDPTIYKIEECEP